MIERAVMTARSVRGDGVDTRADDEPLPGAV